MNAQEAQQLADESLKPSKALLDHIFTEIKKRASKSIRYTSIDINPWKLSNEQLLGLKEHLGALGYTVKISSSYQGKYCDIYW